MVVLAASICTKTGKPLLSRQFVEMTRIRIEGILAAFPKLVGSDNSSKQHTYVETESVRYVYQRIESLFLILITTKGSNIVEDLDTLRLLSKVLPEYCQIANQESISENVFDLVFAFDEVISLGYKEPITLQGIRTNLDMYSHEEKLHQMIRVNKEKAAEREMQRKAGQIKQQKREDAMGSGRGGGSGPSATGFGGSPSDTTTGFASGDTSTTITDTSVPKPATKAPPTRKAGRGMALKKAAKDSSFLQAMAAEEGIESSAMNERNAAESAAVAPGAVAQRQEPIEVKVSETISAILLKDGGVQLLEIKGQIQLTCNIPDAKVQLHLDTFGDTSAFQFQPHPNISKPLYSKSNILALKNENRSFPQGSAVGLLKWRMNSTDESKVPFTITCWPEAIGGNKMNVNIEYSLEASNITLHNVTIIIPLNCNDSPEILSIENGVHRYNSRNQQIIWSIDVVDQENSSASMEFNITTSDESNFFPVLCNFSSQDTLCPINVTQVTPVGSDEPTKFHAEKLLTVEDYQVTTD